MQRFGFGKLGEPRIVRMREKFLHDTGEAGKNGCLVDARVRNSCLTFSLAQSSTPSKEDDVSLLACRLRPNLALLKILY